MFVCAHAVSLVVVPTRLALRCGTVQCQKASVAHVFPNKRGVVNEDNDVKSSVVWGNEVSGSDNHKIFFNQNRQHLVRKTTVEPGKLYLLGDYRGYMGQDSRTYGLVDAASCRGTIVFRLIPVEGLEPEISHEYFELVQ